MKLYLGIDIGGTAVKIALLKEDATIISKTSKSVIFDNYQTPIIETVVKEVKIFMDQNALSSANLNGIGVSATGQIDITSGTVIGTDGKFKTYEGTNIKQVLESKFNVKTEVLNDANAMILAEYWQGVAVGHKQVVGITIGTGVGGGIIVDGKILSGLKGIAGEVGHMSIKKDGDLCTCGNHGCYEKYASTTRLVNDVKKLNLLKEPVNGYSVFENLANPKVNQVYDGWLDDIARGLVDLIHIFNPSLVVIGGGVSGQQELFIEPLSQKIRSKIMPRFNDDLEIKAAYYKNDAGVIGAVYNFMNLSKKV
jgi:glucokinase